MASSENVRKINGREASALLDDGLPKAAAVMEKELFTAARQQIENKKFLLTKNCFVAFSQKYFKNAEKKKTASRIFVTCE